MKTLICPKRFAFTPSETESFCVRKTYNIDRFVHENCKLYDFGQNIKLDKKAHERI